jgi:hypothetical protein
LVIAKQVDKIQHLHKFGSHALVVDDAPISEDIL